ncbi:MAG: DUF4157 domain-containing protein, partial [Proteobacteria bacterium]|nr:DUF4157 domain-containing protein [Pseudomonadota bacterium]
MSQVNRNGFKPSSAPHSLVGADENIAIQESTVESTTGTETASVLQGALGNTVVYGALSGAELGGLGAPLLGDAQMAAAGVDSQPGLASNTAMLKALRLSQASAEGLDMGRADSLIKTSSGGPLPGQHQQRMEQAFGHDFGHVRVHVDGQAQAAAEELNAHAFALGSEIFFGSGKFAPGTPDGDRILVHELTHVVQNDEGRLPSSSNMDVSKPSDPTEREAYQNEVRLFGALDTEVGLDSDVGEEGVEVVEAVEVSVAEPAALENTAEATADIAVGGGEPTDVGTGSGDAISRRASGGGLARRPRNQKEREHKRHLHQTAADLGASVFLPGEELVVEGDDSSHDEDLSPTIDSVPPTPQEEMNRDVALGLMDNTIAGVGETPTPQEVEAKIHRVGNVVDTDAQRATRTVSLLSALSRALGLPSGSIKVRVDDHARSRTEALGTRGVMEHGEVLLNPEQYDPATADGRELLAHEATHVAQLHVDAAPEMVSAPMAEAEASLVGEAFASGQDLGGQAVMGMPASHSAQDGGGGIGAQLVGMVEAMKSALEGSGGELNAQREGMPSTEGQELSDPNQDREAKLEQYEDGVDGIADQIEDLSAFDDLCEAHDDDEGESARSSALTRIKGTERFDKLSGMWGGALAGEEDESRMKESFNNEFDDRGFYESTENAFDDVEEAAKSEGTQKYAEKQAEQQRARDAMNQERPEGQEGEEGGEGEGAAEGGQGGDTPAVEGEAQNPLLTAPVPTERLGTPSFDQAQTRMESGGVWSQVTTEFEHYNEHVGSVQEAANGGMYDRAGQVFGEMFRGFAGGFASGFTSQGLDGLLLDTLGAVGDYAIFAATKGGFKAPFIGPAISLAQVLYDPGAFAQGLGDNISSSWNNFGNGAENFGKAWEAGLSWDAVGYLFSGIADFLGGIADLLTFITSILGVLSAVCYVVGGILIAVGLALSWLGIGVSLLPIGGWFINAGTVLGNIVTVLGPVTMIVKAAAMLYRVLGAMLVPAEDYANQLAAVGTDASGFGEKVGSKVADTATDNLRQGVADRFGRTQQPDHNAGTSDAEAGGSAGRSRAADAEAEINTRVAEAEAVNAEIDRINTARADADADAPSTTRQPDADADTTTTRQPDDADTTTTRQPDDPDTTRQPDADDGTTTRNRTDDPDQPSTTRRVLAATGLEAAWGALTNVRGHVQKLRDAGNDLRRLVTDPGAAAQMGLSQAVGANALAGRTARLNDDAETARTRNQELEAEIQR